MPARQRRTEILCHSLARYAAVAICTLSGLSALQAEAATERVGVAAAVNPQAVGIAPGTGDRALFIGAQVVHDERIRTGELGRTQVVFLDGSALTIGPNADMVIDEFVYDPVSKAGTLAVTAAKGAFRFVGGRISKKKPVVITTPTAVIGIRGGIAMFSVGANTTATFLYGEQMQVTAGNVTRTVSQPGFEVSVMADTKTPSNPKRAAATSLKKSVVGLEATPQSQTGLSKPPVDQDVAGTQLATLGSDRAPQELQGPAPAGGKEKGGSGDSKGDKAEDGPKDQPTNNRQSSPTNSSGFGRNPSPFTSSPVNSLRALAQDSLLGEMTLNATTSSTSKGLSGRFKASNSAPAPNGTLDLDSTRNVTFKAGIVDGGFFTASLNGSTIKLPVGSPGASSNFFSGGGSLGQETVRGSSHYSPDGDFITFDLLVGQNGARATAFAGNPTPASKLPTSGHTDFALTSDFVLASNIAFLPEHIGGSIAPLPGTLGNNQGVIVWDTSSSTSAQRAVGFLQSYISGSGTSQKSVVGLLTGQVLGDSSSHAYIAGQTRGSARLSNGTTYFFEGNVTSTPDGEGDHFFGTGSSLHFGLQSAVDGGNGQITPSATKASNVASTQSYFSNVYASTASQQAATATRTTETLRVFATGAVQSFDSSGLLFSVDGATTTSHNPANASISTNAATNKIQSSLGISNTNFSENMVLSFGDSSSTSGRSLYVDSEGFGAVEAANLSAINGTTVSNQRSYLFSTDSSFKSSGFLPSGVTLCTCKALRWGFWGSDLKLADGQRRRVHLGSWIGGDIPSASEIAGQTGTASFNGHLLASVISGTGSTAQSYLAAGNLSVSYNFSSQSGSLSVSNFDGVNYSGNISKLSTGQENRLMGSISSLSGPTRTGTLNGAFFRSNGQASGAMGGEVEISNGGSTYRATGTFAAHR